MAFGGKKALSGRDLSCYSQIFKKKCRNIIVRFSLKNLSKLYLYGESLDYLNVKQI